MTFNELNLPHEVLLGLKSVGFSTCTLVQEKVLPITLTGRDVMVQSKTGSGKTAVYLITILNHYIKTKGQSKALVVAPTRELAVQIEKDAKALSSKMTGYNTGCFYGGVGYKEQEKEIEDGLSLYVGTPGRLLDYSKSRRIDFRTFDIVVLDEADRMFDMGFFPDIKAMFASFRDKESRQTMLFSATMTSRVKNLAWGYMNNSLEIAVQPEEITVKNITQELFHVSKDEKFDLLLSILKKLNPSSCLIFTNTKDKTVEVSQRLNMNGYKTEYLMGDMAQSKRLETIERMKKGELKYLVATDVAARGLQIDNLELVVNYDIPEDYENYVHRIGRTARAGKSGKAITLACEEYIYGLEAIENYIQMKIPVLWPDEVGLEKVEDKSKDYDSNRHLRAVRRTASSNKSRVKKPTFKDKKVTQKKKDGSENKSATDFNKLSSMTLEERMAYYKKTYSNQSKNEKTIVEKEMPKKKSFFARIISIFKGKKNG